MSSLNPEAPIVVRASDAEVLADGPTSLITLLATHSALTANRATLSVGSPGAPAHFHTKTSEAFFILSGTAQMLAGVEVFTLTAGDFLIVPPTIPHAFAPAPGAEVDMLVLFSPGVARFEYYRLLERVYRGEADPKEIAASAELYDNHYVDSPSWRAARAAS